MPSRLALFYGALQGVQGTGLVSVFCELNSNQERMRGLPSHLIQRKRLLPLVTKFGPSYDSFHYESD